MKIADFYDKSPINIHHPMFSRLLWRAYFGPFKSGDFKSKDDAALDVLAKVYAAMSHPNPDPVVLTWKGRVWVVWYTPVGGWMSGEARPKIVATTGYNSKEEAVAYTAFNAAQSTWDGESDIRDALEFIEHHGGNVRQFQQWVDWQLRYREARENGLNDKDCRTYADDYRIEL